ncbi:MAG: hypothetical protein LBU34_14355 [Planctomycetaceae bacterium]|nr:hypothetical protein [Planctomycetaceae bacterium]
MENHDEINEAKRMVDYLHTITSLSSPGENLAKALAIYYGQNHKVAHRVLIDEIKTLPYPALLFIHGQIITPLTSNTLELRLQVLAVIMQKTNWDGTWYMLDNYFPGRPINCAKLSGHIIENYLYSEATPQEIILETKNYLYDNDIFVVRAALFEIFSWLAVSMFDEQGDAFLRELIEFANSSEDKPLKSIVADIVDCDNKNKAAAKRN